MKLKLRIADAISEDMVRTLVDLSNKRLDRIEELEREIVNLRANASMASEVVDSSIALQKYAADCIESGKLTECGVSISASLSMLKVSDRDKVDSELIRMLV